MLSLYKFGCVSNGRNSYSEFIAALAMAKQTQYVS
jgi:hypothetical protein